SSEYERFSYMLLSPLCFHSRSVRRSKNIPPNSSRLRRGYQAVFHGAPQLSGWCPWQEQDYIFCTSHGSPFHVTYILNSFRSLLKKASLPRIRFHDMRHSAATLLLSMGTHPKVVQEILGHSNIRMTMDIYSHVLPSMQKDAMTKLSRALQQES